MDDESIGLGTTEPQAAGTCATCGRPLTQCGPNGECLRCLVSLGFLADGQETERPAGRGRLTPGPMRYAHFEVEVGVDGFPAELGAGAMAITYRARDTVLNSEVALKVIDRSVAQNPDARSRFLREARAAANFHHPNIARVTYYGEQDGECFYAMELVKGETQGFAFDQFHGVETLAVLLSVIGHPGNVWMMNVRSCARFTQKTRPRAQILRHSALDDLESSFRVQDCIAGAISYGHCSRA